MLPCTPQARIALRDVEAGYARRPVLRQLSAHVPESANTVVLGPNGAGKSTLLGVLAGLLPTTGGAVQGREGRRPGLVVQRSAVPDTLPLTVQEVVTMGRWALRGPWRRLTRHDREQVTACMSELGIRHLARRRFAELSGGQRQRALVAQGLAQEPELFLLDEPTTGFDAEARDAILDVLHRIAAGGSTVVQATHDLTVARRADHCLVLQDGRLLAEGPPREVLDEERAGGGVGVLRAE